jgi:hypothetical protein
MFSMKYVPAIIVHPLPIKFLYQPTSPSKSKPACSGPAMYCPGPFVHVTVQAEGMESVILPCAVAVIVFVPLPDAEPLSMVTPEAGAAVVVVVVVVVGAAVVVVVVVGAAVVVVGATVVVVVGSAVVVVVVGAVSTTGKLISPIFKDSKKMSPL